MDKEMILLVSRFAEYLRMREQQLRCFHKYELQVEGWFKGEMLCFLDQEKQAGRLPDFKLEKKLYVHVGDKRKRISVDIALQFESGSRWVELKHWHIGTQNNQYYGSDWYFKTPAKHCNSCVECGVEQLIKIPENGDKFMLVLLTKNPASKEWTAGVEAFNSSFPRLAVHSLTNPEDYPDCFFLGLLHVLEGGQN